MLSLLTLTATLALARPPALAPPAVLEPADTAVIRQELLAGARVITDVRTGLPRAVFGLALPLGPTADAVAARAVLERLSPALGLAPEALGGVAVSESRFGTVFSFELLASTDGIPLPLLERRIALRVQGGLATTIHSDAVLTPTLHFGAPGLDSPELVTAEAARELARRQAGGVAGVARAFALSLAPGHVEPIWRVPVVVLPFVDHRWIDVAMRGGRVIRDVPSAKDGHRIGGVR